jgi:hypothetical protein
MVANHERGELSLVVDGKRYVLSLTLTAMMEMEDVSGGRTFLQAWQGIQQKQSLKDCMLVLWAALREKHPDLASDDPGAALRQISRFVERAGGLEAVTGQLTELMKLHAQPADLQQGGATNGRPPDAPGTESASPGAAFVSKPSGED